MLIIRCYCVDDNINSTLSYLITSRVYVYCNCRYDERLPVEHVPVTKQLQACTHRIIPSPPISFISSYRAVIVTILPQLSYSG